MTTVILISGGDPFHPTKHLEISRERFDAPRNDEIQMLKLLHKTFPQMRPAGEISLDCRQIELSCNLCREVHLNIGPNLEHMLSFPRICSSLKITDAMKSVKPTNGLYLVCVYCLPKVKNILNQTIGQHRF